MSSLRYDTTTFTDRFNEASRRAGCSGRSPCILSLASRRVMAVGIRERSPVPLYLSGPDLEIYACELAATTLLLARYSRSPKNPALQLLQKSSKSASAGS